MTEDNADLLWSATTPGAPAPPGFAAARDALAALHPSYVRLLVDWAALQPSSAQPPDLEASTSGCSRTVGPCGAYAGIAAELEAIASQQHAARQRGESVPEVVLDLFGVPAWAARAPSGCELPGTQPFSRPITALGLAGYRQLIADLLALGAREGVALPWWSPWNEPNNAQFLSPQREACTPDAPSLAPATYAQLATAMADELSTDGTDHHLLLGELGAYASDAAHRTSIASFVAALPSSAICLSRTWSVHSYASYTARREPFDAVAALEHALDLRGECGRNAHLWVSESGVGAPRPGAPRSSGELQQREGCLALASQLQQWVGDARVEAILQYSFREDPAYPVGLISADLSHIYPAYGLWLYYTQSRARGLDTPPPPALCA